MRSSVDVVDLPKSESSRLSRVSQLYKVDNFHAYETVVLLST